LFWALVGRAVIVRGQRQGVDESQPARSFSSCHGMVVVFAFLPSRECWKASYSGTQFLLGHPQVMGRLQLEPELWPSAKEVPKAKGGVTGNRSMARNYLTDTIARYLQLTPEFGRAQVECLQLFGEVRTWMSSGASHTAPP